MRMAQRQSVVLLSAVLLLFVGAVSVAHAQTDASLIGQAVDPDGAPLPGVTVTATNEGTGVDRVTVTDAEGYYRLHALNIGRYTLTLELPGFKTVQRPDIGLRIGLEASLDFSMELATVEETITITAEQPLVDFTKAEVGTSVGEEQLRDIPVKERRWLDLSLLAPGTSQDNIRARFYNNVNIGGGGQWYENGFTVDGVNNTWAEMGETRQNFPTDSVAEFQLVTQNPRAEDGWASGGMLKVVTKSGSNELHGSVFEFFRDETMNALGVYQSEKIPFSRHQFGGSLGGPIIKNEAHFFIALERFQAQQIFTVNTGGAFPQYDGSHNRDVWRNMATARFDLQSGNTRLFMRYGHEREDFPNKTAGGRAPLSLGFAVPRESVVMGATSVINDRVVNDIRFQYGYSMYQVYSKAGSYSYAPNTIWEAQQAGTLENHIAWKNCDLRINRPSLRLGDCANQMGPEHRWQVREDVSVFVSGEGSTHDLKFGGDANYIPFASDSGGYNLKGTYSFATDAPYDPDDPSTHPYSFTRTRPSSTDVPVWHLAAYAQDAWSPSPNVTVNLGLRYEIQKGSFNEDINDIRFFHPGSPNVTMPIPWHDGTAGSQFGTTADRGDSNNFAPRFGINVDPTGTGDSVIRAGYGLYYQSIRTLTNWGERLWHLRPSIYISNPTYPDPFVGSSFDDYISTAPPNIELLSNNMISPYTHQLSFGLTKQIGNDAALSLDLVHMIGEAKKIDTDVNYFASQADLATGTRPYPQFRRANMDVSEGTSRYTALMVKFDRRYRNGFQFISSYTLSDSKDDITGRPPNQFTPDTQWGPSSVDRRHRFRVSGIAELPWDLMISGSIRIESALPFNANSGTDLNGDGQGGDYVAGTGRNQGCRGLELSTVNSYRSSFGAGNISSISCPMGGSVDIRVSKTVQFGDGGNSIEAIAQAFNVLNTKYYSSPVGNMRSGSFGKSLSAMDARQLELALRFAF